MNTTRDFIRVFVFFFVISFMLLLTYSLSFYISDLFNIFKTPLKIVYISVYSALFSFYFSAYIVYNVKRARALFFVSGLLALFYLHEYQRNIFLLPIVTLFPGLFLAFYLFSGTLSLLFVIVADVVQMRYRHAHEHVKRYHKKAADTKDQEYFV